jgi:recombinational DNA repair protein (RecF pathway)
MSDLPLVGLCAACDCVDQYMYFTPAGAGPFCQECWEALNDPDQALMTEKRLAEAEAEIERLKRVIEISNRAG